MRYSINKCGECNSSNLRQVRLNKGWYFKCMICKESNVTMLPNHEINDKLNSKSEWSCPECTKIIWSDCAVQPLSCRYCGWKDERLK